MVFRPRFPVSVAALLVWLAASTATCDEQSTDFLETWIADAIPREYEKRKDWGKTTRATVGLDVSRRGVRLKKKDVPHGVWKHYRVRLADESHPPRVEIDNIKESASGRMAATFHVAAPLDFWGRTRMYAQGVHLGTYTAEASATVYLRLDCEFGVRVASEQGLPSVVVEPAVNRAEVKLIGLRLRRLSSADGPAVRELSKVVQLLLENELEPHKLTRKLNRAIAKKRERLKWDLADVVGGNDE